MGTRKSDAKENIRRADSRKASRGHLELVTVAFVVALLISAPLLIYKEDQDDTSRSSQTPDTEVSPNLEPSMSWVQSRVSKLTVNRLFIEQDSSELKASINENQVQDLLESSALIKVGETYEFETDSTSWTIAKHLGDDQISGSRVDDAMTALLDANDITWCGTKENGLDFVNRYMNSFGDSFENRGDYEDSIAEYVDCGIGNI